MNSTKNTKYFLKEKPASRVTILDAVDLDSEIQRILKEHLLKIVHSLSPSFVKWEPELDALLRLLIWKVSVSESQCSFGQQLLSAKYSKDINSRRAVAWALLTIGCPYLKHRSRDLSTCFARHAPTDQILRVVGWMDLWAQIATLLNLLVFLREGQFPTLPDRLAGLRTVCADPTVSRVVGYSFMTRELLWHGFIELIVFILPLVNYKYVQRRLSQLVGLRKSHDKSAGLTQGLMYSAATRCAVCQEPPVLPHHMGCPHTFCYYCLQSNRMADPKFECPTCGYSTEDDESIQQVSSRHFVYL